MSSASTGLVLGLATAILAGCSGAHDRLDDRGDGDVDGAPGDADAELVDAGRDGGALTTDAGLGHLDSDRDTILDAEEGTSDPDLDGVPSHLDLDSDGDGISDRQEAGDLDPATPPVECGAELDWSSGMPRSDGAPDYLDTDSDNDGLDDGVERRDGLDPCSVDSDSDGLEDLLEHEYARADCPDRERSAPYSDCAINAACRIPCTEVVVELPYAGGTAERDVYFTAPSTVDVNIARRDDACDPDGVDATRFVQRVMPETFYAASPRTPLRVHLTLRNASVAADDRRHVYVAYLDATAGTATAFERHEVYVVVPAAIR